MALPYDPYSPPSAPLDGPPSQGSTAEVPATIVALLAQTRPWVKLLAILFFVSLGLVGMGLLGALALGGGVLGAPNILALIPAALMLLLYIPPAVFLWRYAASIRRLQEGGGAHALEESIRNQKSFWKYVGILAAVLLCLYALVFIGGILSGALLRGRH